MDNINFHMPDLSTYYFTGNGLVYNRRTRKRKHMRNAWRDIYMLLHDSDKKHHKVLKSEIKQYAKHINEMRNRVNVEYVTKPSKINF